MTEPAADDARRTSDLAFLHDIAPKDDDLIAIRDEIPSLAVGT